MSDSIATIGWREWVALPDWGVPAVKAKVDTGARSSSLHAFNVRVVRRGGKQMVQFEVHPLQRSTARTIHAEAVLAEYRRVRTSGGHETIRPVVITTVELLGCRWPIEITLATRDTMGFRMLLGRQAVRGKFLVDPGRSYLGCRPKTRRRPT